MNVKNIHAINYLNAAFTYCNILCVKQRKISYEIRQKNIKSPTPKQTSPPEKKNLHRLLEFILFIIYDIFGVAS